MGKDTCINVIYDDRQSEDYQRLLDEFKVQGISNSVFWKAVIDKNDVVSSINSSHKMIVSWAKYTKKPFVVIAEQDLHFTCIGAWDYFMQNKPEDYDLYLACTYIPPISNNQVCGFHLYVVNEKFYDKFLSVPSDKHIDTSMNDLGGDYKFCYPFPALQRSGYSFNNKAVVNYNAVLTKEDIYDNPIHNVQGK